MVYHVLLACAEAVAAMTHCCGLHMRLTVLPGGVSRRGSGQLSDCGQQ
ncbi:hypothetical protein [Gordonia sp. i37]|nr:hypothetical protein [Gordonia sp. i37]